MTQTCSPAIADQPFRLHRGTRIPRSPYTIRRLLGSGGMGATYTVAVGSARRSSGRRLALKVLLERHLGRSEMVARLRQEAQLLGQLAHPHIVKLHDTGTLPDARPYFVMDLVEGLDLASELRRLGVFAVPTALTLARQALQALSAVHAQGIVHRDVKLDNLLLDGQGQVRLIDFGIARDMHRNARITAPNLVVGTPRGMAPEQFDPAEVDPRVDVYAVGLLLYEMLVGSGPFDTWRGSVRRMRAAHERDAPMPPSIEAPQLIPPAIDRLVLRALAKQPSERFASSDAMARAISKHLPDLLLQRRQAAPAVTRASPAMPPPRSSGVVPQFNLPRAAP